MTLFDGFDPQFLRQRRLVFPNLADHRLSCVALKEELHDPLGLGADDAVEERGWKRFLSESRLAASKGRLTAAGLYEPAATP